MSPLYILLGSYDSLASLESKIRRCLFFWVFIIVKKQCDGRNRIVPWHLFKILSWAFQGRWGWMTFEVEFWLNSLKYFQRDIYFTLLYFIFYCTLVGNAKGNTAKSNKSELCNCLSYRGLTFSRLAAKLSDPAENFQKNSIKIKT